MRNSLLLFFVLLLIASCSRKKEMPKDILPREKMQEVLWSMISAGEFLNAYILNNDSVQKIAEISKTYGQVFQVHHITKEEFDRSWLYYRGHPEIMKVMLDSLSKKRVINTGQAPFFQKDSANKKTVAPVEVHP
jgi:hypothetical protein